ncbi:MAG: hypothetical protein ACP5QU_09440 [Anaerolineae bacterium]
MAPASSRSNPHPDRQLPPRHTLILATLVLFGALIYLLASLLTYRLGFPLDDSWIHQTYARNLALRGEWAFRPGQPSAGSTSPLWSTLLALGFVLHLSPYFWTYLLGGLALWLLALLAEKLTRQVFPAYRPRWPWVGIFFALEWHFLWAAMSGMETLLHALILTLALSLLWQPSPRYLTVGLLTGLSVWLRPDGLTLLAPVVATILLTSDNWRLRLRSLTLYGIGLGSLFFPYLLFNLVIGGTPLPNTFYAKQAEYAAWQARPWLERMGQMILQLLTGGGIVLLPGWLLWMARAIRQRAGGTLAAMAWMTGYLWLYVSKLPVYQHGRYLIPAMPVFFLWGLWGMLHVVLAKSSSRYRWVLTTSWQASLALVTLAFFLLGARSYGEDVAVIESEMVATAQWAKQNLPPAAVIAAHDIGALGYFDDHPLIDLAGLVSPQVIPFIRDENRLAAYLDQQNTAYLIAFPGFYPRLTSLARPVYCSNGKFASRFGEENMVIYEWKRP